MSSTGPSIIVPITVTAAMIGGTTTLTEPAASETAWVSGGTYALGDLRIRSTTHRVYECVQAHTGHAVLPENDQAFWEDIAPTLLWAPFDTYTSTAATAIGSLTYVLSPGYCNSLALYGLDGANVSIVDKDAPGGSTIFSYSGALFVDPAGWYEYLFVTPVPITKLVFADLPIRPTAELHITVSAAAGVPVGIGMIVMGDFASLLGDQPLFGGTLQGATAEPITYSFIKTNDDGTTQIVRRHKATNLRSTIVLQRSFADEALRRVQEVLDVPVAFITSTSQGYQGLNIFGLLSAQLSYDGPNIATLQITGKGLI